MENEEEKDYEIARDLRERPQLLMTTIGVVGTVLSLLAGLTFSASILFFSFGRELPYGNLFALSIMTNAVLFVFGVLTNNYLAGNIVDGCVEGVKRWSRVMNKFATIGIVLMMMNLTGMALYLRWEMGAVMFVVIFLCVTYVGYNFQKLRKEIRKGKSNRK